MGSTRLDLQTTGLEAITHLRDEPTAPRAIARPLSPSGGREIPAVVPASPMIPGPRKFAIVSTSP